MHDLEARTAAGTSKGALALDRALPATDGLIERLPIGIYSCDREGALVRFNRRAAELWGLSPAAGDAAESYCAAMARQVADVLLTGEADRDREVMVERPDGSRIHVLANIDPVRDEDGELVGAVNCFQDVSAVKSAEARLCESERRARDLLDALPAAVYTTDAQGRITYFNEAAAELAGRRPTLGQDQWCVTWKLLQPDGAPLAHDDCPMAAALKHNRPIRGVEAIAERPDGSRVPFMPFPSPLRDENGALVGAVNMLVDISAQKRAEERQSRLIDELNHRVKNTLASVQSIARHTARQADSLDGFNPIFESRLLALSRAHDLLTGSCWADARLSDVLTQSLLPYGGDARADICCDDVALEPRAALALSMALHELADNAARHGALSMSDGQLRIRARHAAATCGLVIDWTEAGGPSAHAPSTTGFGLRLVETIVVSDLNGEVDIGFAEGGLHCAIAFPLPPAAAIQ